MNYDLIKECLESDDSIHYLRKHLRRHFRGVMPKKHYIVPTSPVVYKISNTVCIEMPSWGSYAYRTILYDFKKELHRRFIFDVQYYDGKTTFMVRKCKI